MGEPAGLWQTVLRRLVLVPVAAGYVLSSSFLAYAPPILYGGGDSIVPSLSALLSLWFFDGWTTSAAGASTAGFLIFTIGSLAVGALAVRLAVTWGRWASVGVAALCTWMVYSFSFALTFDVPFPLRSSRFVLDLGMGFVYTPIGGALGLLFASLAPLVVARTVPADILGPWLHPATEDAEGWDG